MWRIEEAGDSAAPDLRRFVEVVNARAEFFEPGAPIVAARAPGRLDLMGGIADYSGALVLELPLGAATFVAAQVADDASVTVLGANALEIEGEPLVRLPLAALAPADGPLSYADAQALLGRDPARQWAAYVLGALVVLQHEHGARLRRGLRLLVHSDVPAGKGVSSSAAIEVATMQALRAVFNLDLDGRALALLCQMAENLVVGAPCGVMDQMTSACGEQDRLLALLCQPAEIEPPVALPEELEIWGIDSGIRHAVSGADYGSVRVGAFMGYRIIADLAGLAVAPVAEGRVAIADERWHGYLANITPSEWEATFRDQIPETIEGAAFLQRYGGSTDSVTRVDPARTYAVRQPTAHPIYEDHRVRLFRALLQGGARDEEARRLLGELMYQSHASYSACGLGSEGTDRLVELVRAASPAAGLYGAKITGGGSGGTVAVLARRGSRDIVDSVAAAYAAETGRTTAILGGSSPGALQFGVVRLAPVG